jgi:hypothetical protein
MNNMLVVKNMNFGIATKKSMQLIIYSISEVELQGGNIGEVV